jgi:hypothetical protein
VLRPINAATNLFLFPFSYALYDTNGSQVPQEFVEEIGKIFEAILEEVITSLGSWRLLIFSNIIGLSFPITFITCTDWQIKGRNEGRYLYSQGHCNCFGEKSTLEVCII